MQSSLQSLLTKIRNIRPNAQVIVASLILRTDNANQEAIQVAYNSAIPGLVAAQGANFHFVDMHSVLNAKDLGDGTHPNQGGYDKMAGAWVAALHAVAKVEPLSVAMAASRKMHGGGIFDLPLSLTGAPSVECRTGGGAGTHTILFTFSNKVTSGSATVTAGNGNVSGAPTFAGNEMNVNLADITDAQAVTVTLTNVQDAYAQAIATQPITLHMLVGDTTGNGSVNSSDIAHAKAQSGSAVSDANVRADVTIDGAINSSDVAKVKSQSGKSIP
jgi:hypothetical protein